MNSAIIVAAGASRRMGFDKIFAALHGKPVLYWSIAAFQGCKDIDEVVIVTRAEKVDEVQRLVAAEKLTKVVAVVEGGAERHLSVWNGLRAIRAEGSRQVAIHDAARPLITPKLISACVAMAAKKGTACCASPIPDTVKRASHEMLVTEDVERRNLWAMQTPQVFSSALIMQAYASVMARNELVTDEVSAVQKIGKRVSLLENDDYNFKITFPRDLPLAEQVIDIRLGRVKRR
jgi:2-C-methyl-D-erythritol 4-phosphate cytidylyltransferase